MLSLDFLHHTREALPGQSGPLHARVRRSLRDVIETHFENGQRFWPENVLIEQLGVSQVTVRRALKDLASEGVLERRPTGSVVRKVAAQFDVGCLAPQYDSEFLNELLESLAGACQDNGRAFRVHYTHRGQNLQELRRYLDRGPREERFVLLGGVPESTRDLWDALDDRGYRSVCLDTPAPHRPAHFVGVDNALGIRLALQHLYDLGHRRLALLINEPDFHPSVQERAAEFAGWTQEHGLTESFSVNCTTGAWEDSSRAAWNAMPALWEQRPTAILTTSDQGAWAAMNWLSEKGIQVPSDVSVVGFDNSRHNRFTRPPLTSVAHPTGAMARIALELLQNPPGPAQRLLLAPELIVRASTGAASPALASPALASPALASPALASPALAPLASPLAPAYAGQIAPKP